MNNIYWYIIDMSESIKYMILNQEIRSFITNTNNLYSINNGPWPNTAIELLLYIASLRKLKEIR
jgi:hypothetical protein